jgi:hypothetical protein
MSDINSPSTLVIELYNTIHAMPSNGISANSTETNSIMFFSGRAV